MTEGKAVVDYTKPILQALNSLRTESDVLVLYWENRLGVPNGTLPSDGVEIKESENNPLTLDEILDDIYNCASRYTTHFETQG
jgi:hypothetical protein